MTRIRILFALIGESFRLGPQFTRNRGHPEAVEAQLEACRSHVDFFNHLRQLDQETCCEVDVSIDTRTTPYDDALRATYEGAGVKVLRANFVPDSQHTTNVHSYVDMCLDGIDALNEDVDDANVYDTYDMIAFIRIDLFLKDAMKDHFHPTRMMSRITFASITWLPDHKINGHLPRVVDMMAFVPRRYYGTLRGRAFLLDHASWWFLVTHANLSNDDIGLLVDTYHDSDSHKDWNPLYYIVNRPRTNHWRSPGVTFDRDSLDPKPTDTSHLDILRRDRDEAHTPKGRIYFSVMG